MRKRVSVAAVLPAILIGFLIGTSWFAAPPKRAEAANTKVERLDPEDEAATRTVAKYYVKPTDTITPVLKRMGFDPTKTVFGDDQWGSLPIVRKIAIAYQYAEAGAEGSGKAFLARLSADLSRRRPVAKSEETLAEYLKMENVAEKFTFTKPAKETLEQAKNGILLLDLPADIKDAICTVSKYFEGGALGSAVSFLERHTMLSRQKIYDVSVTAENVQEWFVDIVRSVDAMRHREVIKNMVTAVQKKHQAARYEAAFLPLFPPDAPPSSADPFPPPPDRPSPGAPGSDPVSPKPDGKTGDGKEGAQPSTQEPIGPDGRKIDKTRDIDDSSAAKRYSEVIKRDYPDPDSRSNKKMKEGVKGFGGVVFGEKFTADKDLGTPTKVTYTRNIRKPGDKEVTGKLVITLRKGETVELTGVLEEDVFIAKSLLSNKQKDQGVPIWEEGKATGLVGVGNDRDWLPTDKNKTEKHITVFSAKSIRTIPVPAFSPVVLHPAFLDRALGNALINTDTLFRDRRENLYDVAKKQIGEDTSTELVDAFESRHWNSAYMFVDAEVTIAKENGRLVLTRTESEFTKQFPSSHRSVAYLDLRLMTKPAEKEPSDRYDRVLCAEFYRLLPTLIQLDYNLYRVNRFVPTLAVFRWAKQHGAEIVGVPDQVDIQRTFDEVAIPTTLEEIKLVEEAKSGKGPTAITRLKELEESKELAPHLKVLTSVFSKYNAELNIAIDEFSKSLHPLTENRNITREVAKIEIQKLVSVLADKITTISNTCTESLQNAVSSNNPDVLDKVRYWGDIQVHLAISKLDGQEQSTVGLTTDYYPLVKGAKWTYLMGQTEVVVEVSDVTATEAKLTTKHQGKAVAEETIAVKADGVYRTKINGTAITDDKGNAGGVKILGLKDGKPTKGEKWQVAAKVSASEVKGEFSTKGVAETVKVPAGEYKDAVFVEGPKFLIAGTETAVRYWFAPKIGMLKLSYSIAGSDSVPLELKSYEAGK